jgi:capsular polysaccharide biosynthesis protein
MREANMENQENTKYQNPMEYLKIFFRRKWLFLAPAFAGLVLGIVACFVLTPLYESNTLILVEEEKIINPLIQGLAVSTTAVQRMQNIREQILGWNSLVALTKELNLAKNVQTQMQFEGLIMGLRNSIDVQMRGTNIIKISYFGKEPGQTQLITKTLADNLVDENMRTQTKEADLAINFIKEQLEVYKRKIKETEVADLEEQLKKLLIDSTEQHPLVRELRVRLTNARKELESGEYKVAASEKAKDTAAYQALQQEIDKLANPAASLSGGVAYAANGVEPNDPNTAIYKLMLIDKLDAAQARDKNVNEMIYNMLLQKLETAKITQRLEASKQGTRYTVLDPPRMPLKPSKPNKLLVIFIGLFAGCGAGTGLVFGREFMDQSFLDIEDAKNSLEFPVLGGISRITTQEEIDKEKNRKKKLITIALSSSVALIIIAILVAFFR